MKLRIIVTIVLGSLLTCLLGGCGSGGSTPGKNGVQKTVSLGAPIKGIDITIILPAGISVKADATGQALNGVVTLVEPNAALATKLVTAIYSATSNELRITLISDTAFKKGDFFTINCDGYVENAVFDSKNLVVWDENGTTITNASAEIIKF